MDELMSISTPNSRMQLCILSRFLNQEASLYTDMQVYNTKYRDEILSDIESYIKNL
jgi:prephenate dehydrogenase